MKPSTFAGEIMLRPHYVHRQNLFRPAALISDLHKYPTWAVGIYPGFQQLFRE